MISASKDVRADEIFVKLRHCSAVAARRAHARSADEFLNELRCSAGISKLSVPDTR
jgi:hypothetical protein